MAHRKIVFVLLLSVAFAFSGKLSFGEEPVVNSDNSDAENTDAVVDDANEHGKVYKTVDKDGKVIFSSYGDVKLDVHDANKISLPALQPPAPKVTHTVYRAIKITAPENGTDVRDEEVPTTMTVAVELTPVLDKKRGDRFQFYLNDEVYGKTQSNNSITLKNLYRGTYTVRVNVINKNGFKLISSEPVEFYVRQNSVLNNNPSK